MAIVSACIAFSPTYIQAGALAPILFCLGRVLQNFLAAGESMGGAIFLLENTSEKRHDWLSGIYNSSTIGGILLASGGVFLLSHYQVIDSGWRLLYLFGSITALFGCMVRQKLPEKKTYLKFSQTLPDLAKTFWTYRKPLVLIMISSGFSYANYSIALILLNGFIPLISPVTKTQIMSINTCLLILDFCTLPLFGYLASKISREKMMLGASLCVVLCAIPLFTALEGATLFTVIMIRICFVIFGVAFAAPFHAWAQQLIPPAHRYAIISFGYAIGSQALGGSTAVLSLWCFKQTQIISSAAWYWIILAIASTIAIAASLKSKVLEKAIPLIEE